MANLVKICSFSGAVLGGISITTFLVHYESSRSFSSSADWMKEFESIVRDIIFVVPLISAITVALFNNVFKLYDKIEQAYKASVDRHQPMPAATLDAMISDVEKVSGEIISNARYAIIVSLVVYLLFLARRTIGAASLFSMPIAYVIEGISAFLVLTIPHVLFDQFSVIPGFVSTYHTLMITGLPPAKIQADKDISTEQ